MFHLRKMKIKIILSLENFSEKFGLMDLDIGLTGSLLTTKIFGSYMAKNNGIILNISSDLGLLLLIKVFIRVLGSSNQFHTQSLNME